MDPKTFEVWCVYLVFYGFDLKNLKCLLSVLALVKNLERDRALFYLFSGLDVITRKRNPPGVDFKPFSRLPKHEKIVERPCYFHAR
jgi:hypothetical protein